jgi:hypothetical protein
VIDLSKEAVDVLLAAAAHEFDAKIKGCAKALRNLVLLGLMELGPELPRLTKPGRARAVLEQKKLDAVPLSCRPRMIPSGYALEVKP